MLAFVVNGTEKGGFTEGLTAAQTTDVPLYKTIATNFDVQATNCYASDDEKKVKQYYSQYDILCITDYPNSNKTGANSKKYVDVLGKLIDVRPILTMEAFVSDKANWKAKGISGSPKSPTTRQYSRWMLRTVRVRMQRRVVITMAANRHCKASRLVLRCLRMVCCR